MTFDVEETMDLALHPEGLVLEDRLHEQGRHSP